MAWTAGGSAVLRPPFSLKRPESVKAVFRRAKEKTTPPGVAWSFARLSHMLAGCSAGEASFFRHGDKVTQLMNLHERMKISNAR